MNNTPRGASQPSPSLRVSTAHWILLAALSVGATGLAGVQWLPIRDPIGPVPAAVVIASDTPQPPVGHTSLPAAVVADHVRDGLRAYQRGDLAAASESYRRATENNPDDAESLNNLGQVLVRLGRIDEALTFFDRAIALNGRKWAYRFNRARASGLAGDWAGAVAEYRTAAELFPEDYVTSFNLGLALQRAGDDAAAKAAFRRAIDFEPAEPSFHLALGLSEERLGRSVQAAEAYRRYLALAPDAIDREAVSARIATLDVSVPAAHLTPSPR